jgi:dTDP-4-dehydrorhamnose 3,5-epimerase
MIKDLITTPLKIISVEDGDVLHGLKKSESSFSGFGEAYFSEIYYNSIKAWKRHKLMTLSILVPTGSIRFVFFDDRNNNCTFQEIIVSRDDYCRLTVPPMIWMGFQGLSHSTSILLNIANIEHVPDEAENINISDINFDWSRK